MKLLLDTHVWIWSMTEPDRLSRKVSVAIGSPKNELWLSPMSLWEFFLLAGRGRLRLQITPEHWVTNALASAPLQDAALTREVAIESRSLPISLSDPADRFIAATARVYGLTLATADERLLNLPGVDVLAAG